MSVDALVALARSPTAGVGVVLARPSVLLAFALMVVASFTSTFVAVRIGNAIDVNALFFAETRDPAIQVLLDALGPQRTAVVLYLVQRSVDAIVFATAISPLFYWLLGSSAIHASARLSGIRRPYRPMLLLFAYATALTLVPANIATLVFGAGKGVGPQIASLVGVACIGWLLVIAFRAIQAHYEVEGERAIRILVVAVLAFYLVPLVLIVLAAVAIVIAALVLEYF